MLAWKCELAGYTFSFVTLRLELSNFSQRTGCLPFTWSMTKDIGDNGLGNSAVSMGSWRFKS